MAYEQCILEIKNAIGRELTDKERQQVGDVVSETIKKLDREGQLDASGAAVLKAIEEMGQDLKAAAVIEKRNAALNARAQIMTENNFASVWYDAPREGIKAIMDSSVVAREGSRAGVYGHQRSLERNYVGGMVARLAKNELVKVAVSGGLDDQIWRAMAELHMPTPDKEVLSKLTPEAVEIAQIFNDYNELARVNANKAGAWIKKLPGYVIHRSHDSLKIKKAAGLSIPSNDVRHSQAWIRDISERLDWEKTMPDVPVEKRGEVLASMYQQFANGIHVKFGEGGVAGMKGFASIGKKMSHERVLHFKSPELEFEYHKKYGTGNSLVENMVTGLSHMARDTAMMNKLGPNAQANLDAAVEGMKKRYIKEGKGNLAVELAEEYRKQMENTWPMLTGEINIPGNADFAAMSKVVRNVEMMGDLTNVILSQVTDIPTYASAMRYAGDRSAGGFFSGMGEAIENVMGGIGTKITPEQMEIASEVGVMFDVLSSSAGKFGPDMDMPGKTSEMARLMFKVGGVSWWADRLRLGASMGTATRHAAHAGKSMAELPEGMRALFNQFKISASDWDVIRSSAIKTDSQGRNYLTPESVAHAPKETFDSHPLVKKRTEEILKKEEALLKQKELADAKDDAILAKKREELERDKLRAEDDFKSFVDEKIELTGEETQWLKDQIELVKTRIQRAEYLTDIASTVKTEKAKGKLSEKGIERFGQEIGSISERLGIEQGKAEAKIKELEKRIKQSESGLNKSANAKAEAISKKLEALHDKFAKHTLTIVDRIDARNARVKEYQANVGKYIDHARERVRADLVNKYRDMISDIAAMATSEPGAMERGIALQGTRPGTVKGEVARHFMMYKSFMISLMRKHLSREIWGYGAENLSLPKMLSKIVQDPTGSSFGGMANMMLWGTMFGYGAMSMKDLSKGRTPRVPKDADSFKKIFMASAAQSGSFGIYGDFLFGELKSRQGMGPLETFLGPTWQRGSDLTKLFMKYRNGDDAAAATFNFALRNTPGVNAGYNLFYTRWALDYMLVYRAQEMMNPGYLRRMEDKIKKENDQEFLVPPSSVIPYGGR